MKARPFGALAAVALLVACQTVPISGRSQLVLVAEQDVVRLADQHHAKFIQEQSQKGSIVTASDPSAARDVAMVERVGRKIIAAAGLAERYPWQITLVRDKQANAFVLPNGKIVVYTGILPAAAGEAGLAAILGHEVAHVVARHSAERVSQHMLAQTGMQVASVATAIYDPRYQAITGAALGLGLQVGVMLPYSRAHESEADHLGLIYMAKAGYDPAQAIALWERMDTGGARGPEFLSTHPNPATRRAHLRTLLPDAQRYYRDPSLPLPR
ncbi:MAG TPA: M48 family metallopeptidase [Terriglobales bacterium]|nr:M48 family metallopeptidase [Terriglobales bacterium]